MVMAAALSGCVVDEINTTATRAVPDVMFITLAPGLPKKRSRVPAPKCMALEGEKLRQVLP
jgi:hypothetical protein